MVDITRANHLLADFHQLANTKTSRSFDKTFPLKIGIDLGTSSIVLAVLDHQDRPVYGSFEFAEVIRDGLVVNYVEAVQIVSRLVSEAEQVLGVAIEKAATAIPPGTVGNDKKIVSNVLESAGIEVTTVIDEPEAAACLLDMHHGGVIDVGGGTTGISIIENDQVVLTIDEPTGGTHMSLVLAGHYRISFQEAELLKRDHKQERDNFIIVKPVIDKMAEITKTILAQHPISPLYVVGGASYFEEFASAFSAYIGVPVIRPDYPQFVTPLGIAKASILD
ncbi:ethanolamine utilization protein EutJ [Vagococcus sp. BWB3-3]|uniref:Chaperone protein DnaK n=1 Tax=Vagococcus allomyrinae TaxID=2794353 RepID=A0A940P3K6_9ENTE|nr:ethanolamine utilization protein EutJ [Vagococcus allomyrinae]MBP1040822.1 ethanolamine utilization protein EutJ [Vagococcus allomyrinae]